MRGGVLHFDRAESGLASLTPRSKQLDHRACPEQVGTMRAGDDELREAHLVTSIHSQLLP